MKKLILASQSPRRKEILEKMGLEFSVCPSKAEEKIDPNMHPDEMVLNLAKRKASEVYKRQDPDCVVIGSDTMVFLDGKAMGKPADKQRAYQMLKDLSGREHEVKTAIYLKGKDIDTGSVCTTKVKFRSLSDQEIYAYIQTGEPMDKAGAYGIQGRGCILAEKIDGDFFCVMGLPASLLYTVLRDHKIIEY